MVKEIPKGSLEREEERIEFPPPEDSVIAWDAAEEWIRVESKNYGGRRRLLTQLPFCPTCGGKARDHPNVKPVNLCQACYVSYVPFFHTRIERKKI